MNIIDRRGVAMGGQPYNRPLSQLTQIGLHWSGAMTFITNHEDWWKNGRKWRMGGYHFYIDRQGNIYQNYNLTVQTNGVAGENFRTIHICVESDSLANYTKTQEEARDWLLDDLMNTCNIKAKDVRGHGEFPGQTTVCPGYSKAYMDALRHKLDGGNIPEPKIPTKSVNAIAKEVFAGAWGNNPERQTALEAAGYNYSIIQAEVDKIANTPPPRPQIAVNGQFFGNAALIRALQRHFGTSITGNVSNPPTTSQLIRAMQRFYGSPQTGQISRGNNTSALWTAMQRFHGTSVTGKISPSGSHLIQEVQRQINAGTYPRKR